MNKLTRLLATTALTLALAIPAFAQQSTTPPSGQQPPAATDESKPDTGAQTGTQAPSGAASSATAQDEPAAEFPITEQESSQQLASDLIGTPVMGADGAQIGEISDLLLDEEDRIVGAVVSVGGFLGIGSKKVGVPWQSVQVQSQEGRTVAMIEQGEQELTDAEAFRTQEEIEQEAQSQMQSPATPPTTTRQ